MKDSRTIFSNNSDSELWVSNASASSKRTERSLLVGQSPRIRNVLTDGRTSWAAAGQPVLLLGEAGTGKEVVARSIHKVQPVGPFVTIGVRPW